MNKYQIWYDQIIERARTRTLDVYKERHHIVPRAFGGSDDPANLVDLTYREHFLVHWLLTKVCTGYQFRQMLYALHCMTMALNGRPIAGWQYEVAKRALKREALKRQAARKEALLLKQRRERKQKAADSLMAREAGAALRYRRGEMQRNYLSELASKIIMGDPNNLRRSGDVAARRLRRKRKNKKAPPSPLTMEQQLRQVIEEEASA